MVRAFFLAIGFTLMLLGGESMVLDRAVLDQRYSQEVLPAYDPLVDTGPPPMPIKQPRVIIPPEWAPWSLLSASAVVLLYAITLRRGG